MAVISPEQIERFIHAHIHSVEQLEILLLLHSAPDRLWTVQEIDSVIKSNPASITQRLQKLCLSGLVTAVAGPREDYQYAPANDELHRVVQALEAEYRRSRLRIIETIFNPGPKPLHSFAEAFRLRRKDSHG